MYPPEFKQTCNGYLEKGRDRLAMSMGIVSYIHDDMYEIVSVSSETGVFVAGESFPLKDTYCREVYEQQKTIALTEMGGKLGLQLHPLYENLPLEAYIGCPIKIKGRVWGTINFSCMGIHRPGFSREEVGFVEDAATHLGSILEGEQT